jgi:DNA polymerase IV
VSSPRVAYLYVPNFAVALCLRAEPNLARRPLVLTESEDESAEIVACHDHAISHGIAPGMTVAQAGTICPDLVVRLRRHDDEITQSNALYKRLQTLSPHVEEPTPGSFYLDLSGFTLLYRSETELAQHILAVTGIVGYSLRLGIAANTFVARVAAEQSADHRFTIVPPGEERSFLAPLSISCLSLSGERQEILRDLGIRTIGQLAAMRSNELISRFGDEGSLLADQVRGDGASRLDANSAEDPLSETVWFTFPLDTITLLIPYVEQVLAGLMARLGRFSHGCCCVQIMLHLDDRTARTYDLMVERPTLSVARFLRQLTLTLRRATFSSGVTGLTLTIPAVRELLTDQISLQPSGAGLTDRPDQWSTLTDTDSLRVPHLAEGVTPEQQFSLDDPDSPAIPLLTETVNRFMQPLYALDSLVGLRLVEPPQPLQVTLNDHQPAFLSGLLASSGDLHASLPITRSRGPWELCGGWWHVPFDRLYYETETNTHERFLLYYDRLASRWYLQGLFD